MKSEIVIKGTLEKPEVVIAKEALDLKSSCLDAMSKIQKCESDEDEKLIAETIKPVTKLIADIEKARVDVKAPFLQAGRDIDAKAKEFSESLMLGKKHVLGFLTGWLDKKERAAAAIRAEEERKRQDLIEEQRKQEEELRKKQEAAKTETQKAIIESKIEISQQKTMDQLRQSTVIAQEAVPVKAQGVVSKKEAKFDIKDIKAFYAKFPHLCKDPEPKTAAIKSAITSGLLKSCPEIEVWEETVASVR